MEIGPLGLGFYKNFAKGLYTAVSFSGAIAGGTDTLNGGAGNGGVAVEIIVAGPTGEAVVPANDTSRHNLGVAVEPRSSVGAGIDGHKSIVPAPILCCV